MQSQYNQPNLRIYAMRPPAMRVKGEPLPQPAKKKVIRSNRPVQPKNVNKARNGSSKQSPQALREKAKPATESMRPTTPTPPPPPQPVPASVSSAQSLQSKGTTQSPAPAVHANEKGKAKLSKAQRRRQRKQKTIANPKPMREKTMSPTPLLKQEKTASISTKPEARPMEPSKAAAKPTEK